MTHRWHLIVIISQRVTSLLDSVDLDQIATVGAAWSGSTLFASIIKESMTLCNYLQQMTFSYAFFVCAILPVIQCTYHKLISCMNGKKCEWLCQWSYTYEPWHEISNNVVCASSKGSDQPAWLSLGIRAVWSKPLLVTWILYDCYATDWTAFKASKLKRRLHRLVWVYTCQNATLLEITCHGSYGFQQDKVSQNIYLKN